MVAANAGGIISPTFPFHSPLYLRFEENELGKRLNIIELPVRVWWHADHCSRSMHQRINVPVSPPPSRRSPGDVIAREMWPGFALPPMPLRMRRDVAGQASYSFCLNDDELRVQCFLIDKRCCDGA